ncbi:hypothetical protein CMV_006041, partial [Castanea mollissima]
MPLPPVARAFTGKISVSLSFIAMPSMAQGGLRNFTENPNQRNCKFPNHEAKVDHFSRKQKIAQHRKSLPVASVEKRLVDEVRKNDTLIIVELPQFLFNAGFCRDGRTIGITQPRRVAAVTVAKRVAEECDVQLGQRVGYSIRFDDTTSGSTRIKYMTDGLLLREALLDPYLSKYSVIIVDEAHERTVHTDVLLGLLKNVQKARSKTSNDRLNIENKRTNDRTLLDKDNEDQAISFLKQCQGSKFPPLKLVIMSASLDAQGFSEYFGGAKAVHIQGRQFPVDILYTHYAEPDYLDAALITIFQ